MSYKTDTFEKELSFIKNEKIKEFAIKAVELLPDYFFEIPASSSGKYHSKYALGHGGLSRHVKAAVRTGVELLNLKMFKFTEDEKDLIITSLILHDGTKSGLPKQEFSVSTHPLIMTEYLKSSEELKDIISDRYFSLIVTGVNHHMGEFVFDYKTKKQVLEMPDTKFENFIFMCDYISSRKLFEVNFDAEVIRKLPQNNPWQNRQSVVQL